MRRHTPLHALCAALILSGCLLPGRREPAEPKANAGFFQDYALLRPARIVRHAYLKPGTDLHRYSSVRIADFENYSGRPIDPEALRLVAESTTESLQALPPSRRPFQLVDRSPRGASN